MTEQELDPKVKEMIFDISRSLYREVHRLYDCGGVDPEKYEDNYLLPKILLTAALATVMRGYAPLNDKDKRVVNNLKHF